jgi:hypothetical protein
VATVVSLASLAAVVVAGAGTTAVAAAVRAAILASVAAVQAAVVVRRSLKRPRPVSPTRAEQPHPATAR